jgi:hypothetical protein
MHSLKIPGVWLVATVLPSALFFFRALSAQETPQPTCPPDYRIHIGDVLQILVYQHPELSRRVVVDGGGNRIVTAEGVKASTMDVTKLIHAKRETANLFSGDIDEPPENCGAPLKERELGWPNQSNESPTPPSAPTSTSPAPDPDAIATSATSSSRSSSTSRFAPSSIPA